ncbi:YicC/YloC family endoribonuclease [Aestuariivirga sp.]|jgi:uncharacterized protein (TIGR00255 family)|uniref:YicC/YloC family endoribonuclease n=1 Tax=Aestuariivirga sp. TaxID=2650926 RepID=UPI0037847582
MPISSMTGFARAAGEHQGLLWHWEIKSVNGKSLDLRLRLPPGYEALDIPVRTALTGVIRRGSLQATLVVGGGLPRETLRINTEILDRLVAAGEALRERIGGEPLRADMLLSIRGVVDVAPVPEDEAALDQRNAAILQGFNEALMGLAVARRAEGERLHAIVANQVSRIEELAAAARSSPARNPDAIRAKLAEQVSRLLDTGTALDPGRLHQEAVIMASRADIQEELDRLDAHVQAARSLLVTPDAIGRKLDFLAQEFNREANTLCAKASDRSLAATGLELKTVIDQLREQVQNIE